MTQHSAGIRDPGANVTPLPDPLVISVLYFEDRIHLREFAWLRKGLADMLITDLSQAPGLEVVQREHLEEVLREQSLQAAGRVEEKTAVRIGRLTGATVILLGSATRVGDTLRLDAHFLDVERGTVLGAASVDGRLDDILLLEKELASRLLAFLRRDSALGAGAVAPAITPSHSPDAPRRVPSPWPGSGKTDPFPIAPTRPGSAEAEPFPLARQHTPSRDAAAALYEGLDAADREDIDEALAKFESALKKNPRYGDAERQYERTLRRIDEERLWSRAFDPNGGEQDRVRVGARLADDLFREGLTAEIDARGEAKDSQVHILIHFDGAPIQRLRTGIERLGGTITERDGALILRLRHPEIQSGFVRAVEVRRRVFLHLQTRDGRQVAVYSRLREWEGQHWISVGKGGDVVLKIEQRIFQTVLSQHLPFDPPLSFWITVEPVPREQAVLQVELIRTGEDGRETLLSPRPEGQLRQAAINSELSESEVEEVRLQLTREFERLWDPGVWERIPGPGYLPSARRSIMVSAQIQERKLAVSHILGSSGDLSYDEACLAAVSGADGSRLEPVLARLARVEKVVRIRVSCDLLKDVPSLLDANPDAVPHARQRP